MDHLQMQFFMEQKGYSVVDLSEITGIPEETLEKILNGEEICTDYRILLKLERALGEGTLCVRERQPDFFRNRKHTLKDYYALPDEKRVELIDGEFYDMASPSVAHQEMILEIAIVIRQYIRKNKGKCKVLIAPCDVQLDCDQYTMVQPDIMIVCKPEKITKRCVVGAPDFVLEVLSPSTRKKDITIKLKKYQAAGVREYWMVDIEKGHVIVYFFEKGSYPTIYGIRDQIPVRIYEGKLVIDFEKISVL